MRPPARDPGAGRVPLLTQGFRLSPYAALLRLPGAARHVVAALVGRLPAGMAPLAIVLGVQAATGSYATAGLVAGSFSIASSLTGPVQGRMIDRFGQLWVLLSGSALLAVAFLGLAAAASAQAPAGTLAGLAVLGGIGNPPLSSCMRALWPPLLAQDGADPEAPSLTTAYAFESTTQELIFITGPLVVGLCVVVASPLAALVVAAGCSLAGTTVFATGRLSRAWRGAARHPDWAGAMRAPGIRTIVVAAFLAGLAVGQVEVAVAAFADEAGARGSAGVLLAVWSLGSMAGGIWYGGREWAAPAGRRYLVLAWLVALGLGAPALALNVPLMGAAMFAAGLALAPWLATNYLLVDRLAPAGTVTEAFTWILTGFMSGLAAGAATSGLLVEAAGVRTALVAPVAAMSLAAVVALARRGTLVPAAAHPPAVG